MNRIYIMPKIIFVFLVFLFLLRMTEWYYMIMFAFISIIIVLAYEVLNLALTGKYYIHLIEKGKEVSKDKIYNVVHRTIGLANAVMRMDVSVENYEYFDKNKNYLIVPNHQSNADATVMMETFKSPILFVSKFSMSQVVIVKDWMNLMGCLFLKKDDMRGQITVMNETAEKIKGGDSVIIFPEGRRSFARDMNEFHSGTFKMATKTMVDILPVTINHVWKLRHHFPWRKTTVHVYIHKPISYEEYKEMGTAEIAEMVQKIVGSKLE